MNLKKIEMPWKRMEMENNMKDEYSDLLDL